MDSLMKKSFQIIPPFLASFALAFLMLAKKEEEEGDGQSPVG